MFNSLLSFLSRLAGAIRGRAAGEEFDAEIAAHLDLLAAEHQRRGLPREEAILAARRDFGGVTQVREQQREQRGFPKLTDLWVDTRYAFRILRTNPGFTALSILTLTLGIGVNTTLFSAFNAVALKPLPVTDPGRVVRLERWFESRSLGSAQYAFSFPEYTYLRSHSGSLRSLVASSWTYDAQSGVEHLSGQSVSGNYFSDLGIRPALGRTFRPEEDGAPGEHPVLVLSHAFWTRRYQADPLVLGQTLKLNDTSFTIVGVAPAGFPGTAIPPRAPDFWAPIAMHSQLVPGRDWRNDPSDGEFILFGRLAAGIAQKTAQSEAAVLLAQFSSGHTSPDKTIALTLQRPTYLGNTEDIRFLAAVAGLMLVVGLIWLIACANLAGMMLSRAAARQSEMAVRLALGGSRGRILRQLLTESTLLALIGGSTGLLFATWAGKFLWIALQGALRGSFGDSIDISFAPDLRVFIYTLALALVTGLVFGLSPALQLAKADLTGALKQDGATLGARINRSKFRSLLVTAQVTASMLLLITSGLLTRGLARSQDARPGFDAQSVYLLDVDFGAVPQRAAALQQQLYQALQTAPEIRSIAMGTVPMMGTWTPPLHAAGTVTRTLASYASPGYFATLGVPLRRGRDFTFAESHRSGAVTVISESTARALWPHDDPIGKRLQLDMNFGGKLTEFEVVGVVADVRFANLSRTDPMHVYLTGESPRNTGMLFRNAGDASSALAAARKAAAAIDPTLLTSLSVRSLESSALRVQRGMANLYAGFAAILAILAVTLAAIGIYGVMSYLVSQRTREIGILMALGAEPSNILRSVILQGLRPVFAGSVVGLLAAGLLSGLLHATLIFPGSVDVLYGVPWWDPVTFLANCGFLTAVAALASAAPAWRALRVDPMGALRGE